MKCWCHSEEGVLSEFICLKTTLPHTTAAKLCMCLDGAKKSYVFNVYIYPGKDSDGVADY